MQEPRTWSYEPLLEVAAVSFLFFLLASSRHTGSWNHWRLRVIFLVRLGYEIYCQYVFLHIRSAPPGAVSYILHCLLRTNICKARGCEDARSFLDQGCVKRKWRIWLLSMDSILFFEDVVLSHSEDVALNLGERRVKVRDWYNQGNIIRDIKRLTWRGAFKFSLSFWSQQESPRWTRLPLRSRWQQRQVFGTRKDPWTCPWNPRHVRLALNHTRLQFSGKTSLSPFALFIWKQTGSYRHTAVNDYHTQTTCFDVVENWFSICALRPGCVNVHILIYPTIRTWPSRAMLRRQREIGTLLCAEWHMSQLSGRARLPCQTRFPAPLRGLVLWTTESLFLLWGVLVIVIAAFSLSRIIFFVSPTHLFVLLLGVIVTSIALVRLSSHRWRKLAPWRWQTLAS